MGEDLGVLDALGMGLLLRADAVVNTPLLETFWLRVDNGDNVVLERISINKDLHHDVWQLVESLEFFRNDVFALA